MPGTVSERITLHGTRGRNGTERKSGRRDQANPETAASNYFIEQFGKAGGRKK
jgi:hypothetical protein